MKSLSFLNYALFAATTVVAQFNPDPSFFPWDFSLTSTGMTLLAPVGSIFTNVTATWDFPIESSSVDTAGLEWITQYASVDLLPEVFEFQSEDGPIIPFPPTCGYFLQVGINITENYLTDQDAFNSNGILNAFAFYTWNNITTNITSLDGTLITFVPGETVTVTLLLSEDGTQATVLYESTIHGLIEISLSGGSLCLESVQWAVGSPTLVQPLGFASDFANCRAGLLDLETGDISVLGPDSGGFTILDTVAQDDGSDGAISTIAGPSSPTDSGFVFVFDADDFEY